MTRIPRVVLAIESSRGSERAFLRGVVEYAHRHGPWSLCWEPGGWAEGWPRLRGGGTDAIVMRDDQDWERVLDAGVPTVVLGHGRGEAVGAVNVATDSAAIARLGVEHLVQCGFRHFAFCAEADDEAGNSWPELREQHFRRHLRGAGFEAHEYRISGARRAGDPALAQRRLAQWLRGLPKPVGLLAVNDDCGAWVLEACKSAELRVPEQIGVVGVDDDEIVCGLAHPSLSSVAVNFERAGYEAAQALHRLLCDEPEAPRCILAHPTHVVARRSTDLAAVADPAVSKALRFIHEHARQAMGVDDVAAAAGLSRRTLERRFRQATGSSVLSQIRRARTDQMARLLRETDLTVNQIAEALRMGDAQHVARYFASAKQLNPSAYRRRYGGRSGAPATRGDLEQSAVVSRPGESHDRGGDSPWSTAGRSRGAKHKYNL